MNQSPESFWNYSTALYGKEGIAPACLSLQDTFGLDVNLLMFCLWYGENFGLLTNHQVAEVLEISSAWSAVAVVPLRTVRRSIKDDKSISELPEYSAISLWREKVKNLELEAEKIQQLMLERTVKTSWNSLRSEESNYDGEKIQGSTEPDAGKHNLSLLISAMNLPLNIAEQQDLQTILSGSRLN